MSSFQDLSNEKLPSPAIPDSGIQGFNASEVWERVKHAAPDIARDLAFKVDARSKDPFRLIKEVKIKRVGLSPTQLELFIALRYC